MKHEANTFVLRGGKSTRERYEAACHHWNTGRWRLSKADVLRWYHKALRNIFAHALGDQQRVFLEQYPPTLRMFDENTRLSQVLKSG